MIQSIMETMRWTEITSSPSTNNNNNGNDQSGSNNNSQGAPTIKNHSVTYFNNYLYCFGGYDGRRNHLTLLLYSIKEQRWIRPHHVNPNNNDNSPIPPSAVAAAVAAFSTEENNDMDIQDSSGIESLEQGEVAGQQQALQQLGDGGLGVEPDVAAVDPIVPLEQPIQQQQQQQQQQIPALQQQQQQPQFNMVNSYRHRDLMGGDTSILVTGNPPPGRNGHSATLATDPDDEDNARIIIIGGWLGTGPLAASDMHVLDISNGGRRLRWYQPAVKGTPPGPCNMHSADYVSSRREVYVFRGGNGREYLNDLHALDVRTMTWRKVETTGEIPQQRANHSSAILEETGELFIFGGWNGTERLNDIHILDTETSNWTCPHAGGVLPHPRAGMTLTALRGRLYLFGGSGTSSKCFQDLQILDRDEMAWLDVTQYEGRNHRVGGGNGYDDHHHHINNNNNAPFPQHYNMQQLPPPPQHHHIMNQPQGQDGTYHPPQWSFGGYDDDSRMGSAPMDLGSDAQGHARVGSFTSSRADWRSRELAARPRSGAVIASPNPNDQDTIPTVIIHGRGPGRRAGHTATAVNRKIYVFGGSCGSDYLNDFYVLDTDPPPRAVVSEPTSLDLVERRLRHFFNDSEFSDVTFVVQGRKVYGHKMILAIVSDCFRAMFTAGFRESSSSEIVITDCSYEAFLAVMEYIYTGAHPSINTAGSNATPERLGQMVEILELADRFFLDNLKEVCETELQPCVNADTVEYLLQVSQKTNAMQLIAVCEHYVRNRDTA